MKKHRQGTKPKEVLFRMDTLTVAWLIVVSQWFMGNVKAHYPFSLSSPNFCGTF